MFRHLLSHIRRSRITGFGTATFSPRAKLRRSLQLEEMESRLVPSSVGIVNGALQVSCTGSNNEVAVDRISYYPFLGPATLVNLNGSHTVWAESAFTKISISTFNPLSPSGNNRINLQANVKPVDIQLGNNNVVYVGEHYNDLGRIQGFVTVNAFGVGPNTLLVGDFNNPHGETWQIGSGDPTHGFVSRSGTATISYYLMNGGLIVYGTAGASTYDVYQTHAWKTTLFTNSGSDTVNVRRTTGELAIYGVANGTVNVGDGGSVQNIRGSVSIVGPAAGAYTTVNIDDQYDKDLRVATLDTYTPAGDTSYARVRDLAPAPISSRCAGTREMIVRTGIGEAVVGVLSTGPLGPGGGGVLTLEGHSDQTYVTVGGNDGTVQQIRGTLRITNPRIFTWLRVADGSDGAYHDNVHLDSVILGGGLYGQITGLAPAAIQYRYNQTSVLSVDTGPGGARVNVLGTGVDTFLSFAGNNTSYALGADRGLQSLQGQVWIGSYDGRADVDLNDVGDRDNRTVALDTFRPDTEYVEVFGLTPRPVTIRSYSIRTLGIEGGSGGDTFEVQHTSAYSFPTSIYTNFGNNIVNVHATAVSTLAVYLSGQDTANIGDAANGLAAILNPVTVVGNAPGAGDTINVFDQANPNPETYTITDTDLSTSTRQIVNFQDFDTLMLFPSLDPATSVNDGHDPNLYALNVSYDPPPGPAPAAREGGDSARQLPLRAETMLMDSGSAQLFAETVREGATAATDAMLTGLLAHAANPLSAPALAVDLALADLLNIR